MKKYIIKSIIFVLIFCFVVSGISLAKTGAIKDSDFLNLRERPTTESGILVKMPADAKFEILDDSDYWFKIKYNDYTGYVNGEYVKTVQGEPTTPEQPQEPVQEPEPEPTTPSGNEPVTTAKKGTVNKSSDVYSLPLLNSIKVGSLSNNNEVSIISEAGKWIYIQNSKISGWIFKDNIK